MIDRIITILTILSLLISTNAFSQKGSQLINLSEGIITTYQFKGVTPTSDMDIPFPITGALFLSYWYFLAEGLAVGVAAGIDNQWGNLTGGSSVYPDTYTGWHGEYYRRTQTIAGELQVNYVTGEKVVMYGTAGTGYTFSRLRREYNFRLYPGAPAPVQYVDESGFNWHVTAFGMRTLGRAAFFLECGAGYKGIFSLGVSYKLSKVSNLESRFGSLGCSSRVANSAQPGNLVARPYTFSS